ncbi:imidazolonepropionase [Janibacter sp. G56]|uniref:imidazolonepropionase n=1 Tax=Janibacter sp. G56 TaxID=3418717 RepID=UPI003D00C459
MTSRRSTLITGVGELLTCDDTHEGGALAPLSDAAVVVEDGVIAWVGPRADAPTTTDAKVDLDGRALVPGFVDSHAHLVFAGDRAAEFAARMAGESYDGGGIGVTVAATRGASDDDLRTLLATRVAEMRAQGTTTVEIKSGYGLTVADEARALRLAREVTPETTYLGAHVVPAEYRDDRAGYVALVTGEMLTACAPHARWSDVFCEPASPHAFTEDESREVLRAGIAAGLLPRVHGNQLGAGPGVRLAVEVGAASVDHCTFLGADDVAALAGSDTVATLLPGVEFSTRSPYPEAGALLDAGVSIALATDCNPGTCYSSSIPFVIALAVREMGLTPAQAVYAATAGGAKALRRNDIGRIAIGVRADLTVLDAPSHQHLAYRPGVPIARALDLS